MEFIIISIMQKNHMAEIEAFLSFPFIQRSLFAGILLAIVAATLGVFVVLRRMSFFSDAIAHASLTGVAIGLLLQIHPTIGAISISVLVGLMLGFIMRKRALAADTIIGVLFSSSVALAIFIISLLPGLQIDITGLLFGNILTTTQADIFMAILLFVLTVLFVRFATKPMLKHTFDPDIAEIEHKNIQLINYLFLALLAFTIAVSLKIVGAILVSALIIIPAASAQNISANLRSMAVWSFVFGLVSVVIGMYLSFVFDTPSGSTIVLASTTIFLLSLALKKGN